MRAFQTQLRCSVALLLTVIFLTPGVMGQFGSGVEGTVQDVTKGVVPGVAVSLINKDTGTVLTINTTDTGYYSFPTLPPGNYLLKAEMPGFKTTLQDNVRLSVAEKITVNPATRSGRTDHRGHRVNGAALSGDFPGACLWPGRTREDP